MKSNSKARPRSRTPRQLPRKEKDIESEILAWLNLQPGCYAWKNKSMGTFNSKRGVYLRPHGRFTEKGTSDILGIWRGLMLCIEVKSARGQLMPHQAVFLERMNELGAIAFVARSLEDVRAGLLERQILDAERLIERPR